MSYPIACEIHDPLFCGLDWEQNAGVCPPEKQNVISLVGDINFIGFKLSNAQLNKLKDWASTSTRDGEWSLTRLEVRKHTCLSLTRYPDKKRMLFKPTHP